MLQCLLLRTNLEYFFSKKQIKQENLQIETTHYIHSIFIQRRKPHL